MSVVLDRVFSADRRKYRRFKVPSDAFAIIKRPRFKIGQIMDISMSGIALCYLDQPLEVGLLRSFDMLLADSGFFLPKIRASLVWDAPCRLLVPDDPASIRQCGIKFENLTSMQLAKLTYFIPQHSDGFAHDRRYSAM